jgi:hypothetical protein
MKSKPWFFWLKKKSKKKMSWCLDAPEDDVITLSAGLLANPDVPLSRYTFVLWILPA